MKLYCLKLSLARVAATLVSSCATTPTTTTTTTSTTEHRKLSGGLH